jgi:SLOG cluster4 family
MAKPMRPSVRPWRGYLWNTACTCSPVEDQALWLRWSQFFVEDPKRTAGQCCLGVLPCDENDLSTKKTGYPNDWVEIPIQTHLPGKKKGVDTPKDHNSRNYINVLTAKAVIGLPGGKGTLAEIELAVEHKRPCVTFLDNEDQIEGLLESELRDKVQNVDEAKLDKFLKAVLKAPKAASGSKCSAALDIV